MRNDGSRCYSRQRLIAEEGNSITSSACMKYLQAWCSWHDTNPGSDSWLNYFVLLKQIRIDLFTLSNQYRIRFMYRSLIPFAIIKWSEDDIIYIILER